LHSCDALVGILHEGFRESPWCDQEVGIVLGREKPGNCSGASLRQFHRWRRILGCQRPSAPTPSMTSDSSSPTRRSPERPRGCAGSARPPTARR
jgi:hypothetical protein